MKILFASFVVLIFSFSQAISSTVTISTGEYAPYSGYTLYKNGFACHVISEAFERVGYSVKFSFFPWKRAYLEAKEGKFHATSPWVTNPERLLYFHYSQPIYRSKALLYHLKSKPIPDWKSLSDLRPYRFGATRGYTYIKEFWDLHENGVLNVEVTNTDVANLNKLIFNRIDIFPINEMVAIDLINKHFSVNQRSEFAASSKPISNFPGSILFPRILNDSKKRLDDFNKGLDIIKKDGTYDRMHRDLLAGKYSLKD